MKGKTRIIARALCGDKRKKAYKDAKAELIIRAPRDPVARKALEAIEPGMHFRTAEAPTQSADSTNRKTLHLKQRQAYGVSAGAIKSMQDGRAKLAAKNPNAPRQDRAPKPLPPMDEIKKQARVRKEALAKKQVAG